MLTTTFRFYLIAFLLLLSSWAAQAQRIAAGNQYTASIHADGTLWAWGWNQYGQLGEGTQTTRPTQTQVGTATTWQSVATGSQHTLAIRSNGTLWAWGNNSSGQLGLGTTTPAQQRTPVQVGTATTWRSVSAGTNFTLAVRTDGTLWAWGLNTYGQLGTGGSTTTPQPTPVQIGTATTWQSVSAGTQHALALRTDGTLWVWGDNSFGQLGTGSATTTPQLTPVQLGTATWQSMAAGPQHSLAIRADGTLWSWGYNGYGQLGNGSTSFQAQPTPAQVGTATTWRSVAASYHSLALRADGTLWAWGWNRYGQLGDGTSTNQVVPTRVGTATTWASVAAGVSHTAAQRTDGTTWTWGYNYYGQLGTGFLYQTVPLELVPGSTWRSAAASTSTVAIRTTGTLWGWGFNGSGQLGNSNGPLGFDFNAFSPVQISATTDWQQVAAGPNQTLALRTTGTLWAAGYNGDGQLGLGAVSSTSTLTQVGTATTWRAVATNQTHTLALRTDGTLWAWGTSTKGQLGTGTTTKQATPVQIGTATTWQSIAAGYDFSLAIRTDGTLWAWGSNSSGQLGDGTTINRLAPVQIGTATIWKSVSAGSYSAVALRQDGTLWSWGDASSSTGTIQLVPTQVGTATTWASATAGAYHALAIRTNGTLWSWGDNFNGQLGLGTLTDQYTPQQVGTATTWASAAGGWGHSIALRTDGTLWGWGDNYDGGLAQSPVNSLPLYIPDLQPLATAAASATTAWVLAPNPARGQVQLLGLPVGPVAVHLFDAQGRLVRTATTTSLELADLAPGIYLLRATAAGATRTLRLAVE